MSKKYESLSLELQKFIKKQKIFFVATGPAERRINLSPKGTDSFRIIDEKTIIWLNLTGSGNETAAHLLEDDRMTIMFCAFEGKPLILRLYGRAKSYHPRDDFYQKHIDEFPKDIGARQIIKMNVEMVQTSCGFAVPLMEFKEERKILKDWSDKKGEQGIKDYWLEKNMKSLDGVETLILKDE